MKFEELYYSKISPFLERVYYPHFEPIPERKTYVECPRCGEQLEKGEIFCYNCGLNFPSMEDIDAYADMCDEEEMNDV